MDHLVGACHIPWHRAHIGSSNHDLTLARAPPSRQPGQDRAGRPRAGGPPKAGADASASAHVGARGPTGRPTLAAFVEALHGLDAPTLRVSTGLTRVYKLMTNPARPCVPEARGARCRGGRGRARRERPGCTARTRGPLRRGRGAGDGARRAIELRCQGGRASEALLVRAAAGARAHRGGGARTQSRPRRCRSRTRSRRRRSRGPARPRLLRAPGWTRRRRGRPRRPGGTRHRRRRWRGRTRGLANWRGFVSRST